MEIKKLPKHIINKLKAGEIIERPFSVVKELIENSLDAGADEVIVEVSDGGKKLIRVQDNGYGIDAKYIDMSIERYATSKIENEDDLQNISSYGFRGEALASISEVSKFTLQTKSKEDKIGTELIKIGEDISKKNISLPENGTIIFVNDIFFNIPARYKFLKSANTEFNYIREIFLDYALVNYDKSFKLIKDGKTVFDLIATQDTMQRILDIFKKDWQKHIKVVQKRDDNLNIYGLISDAGLTFITPENIKIFVNKRPVQDKIIKRAILQAYERQIPHNEYPLAVLFLEVEFGLLDVNVHPRKLEVRFLDPGNIFNFVKQSIQEVFGEDKITSVSLGGNKSSRTGYKSGSNKTTQTGFDFSSDVFGTQEMFKEVDHGDFVIIGQLWNTYILIQSGECMYVVDQHALAERIAFEKMKKDINENSLKPEKLLSPIKLEVSKNVDLDSKINQLQNIGFDIEKISDNKIIVYSVPIVFVQYRVDIQVLLDKILYLEEINMDIAVDNILATKACKISIKAGDKLSFLEMQRLIRDGFDIIKGMFVCQHGRPSFVKIDKFDIEKFFNR